MCQLLIYNDNRVLAKFRLVATMSLTKAFCCTQVFFFKIIALKILTETTLEWLNEYVVCQKKKKIIYSFEISDVV